MASVRSGIRESDILTILLESGYQDISSPVPKLHLRGNQEEQTNKGALSRYKDESYAQAVAIACCSQPFHVSSTLSFKFRF